ncbi:MULTISPECIES: PucR family transcriptional regulator [Streptomyces]|uniref:Transcriptional regulator n=1 Tax=Streptomyces lasiicapitis TaxID=1923961 RepID=A0ABQ2M190_9ACTN|nr:MULTISPECIES: PucR family transcriptional regulator [Streptomyces]QIB48302.1 PucR family transcriptional regulator [Streptomyces aureoverticillatus]GGO45527.1 transcriptional regulator [Streptomyces lasiicapitis]
MDACTLGALMGVVGSTALRLHTAPAGPGAPVTEALLYDAHAPLPHAPGALLLAVGVRAAAAGSLVRAAAKAGMTGVVVRGEDGPVDEAEAHGVALLAVDEEASWHQVHLMLASAIGARSAPSSGLGDLFALADAIAAATGGATAVEDPRQRILAYSTVPGQPVDEDRRQGILGLQVPDSVDNGDQVRLVFGSDAPVRLPSLSADNLPRLAVAVRAGGETLGAIWVVDGGTLAPDAEDTLAQGASTAALLLLRARAAQELDRDQNTGLLRRLLDGTADASTVAHRLGWDSVRVAAFALDSAASVPDAERTLLRLLDVVRLQCEARYGRHACVSLDGVVYALLPAPGEDGAPRTPQERPTADRRHRQLAEDIVHRAGQSLRVPVRAALGEVVPDLGGVADSRADADTVLRLLHDALPVATVDEVRPKVTLLRLADVMREQPELGAGAWRQVLAADAEHGTDYARTLMSWFDAGCDVAGAAKALSVHPNTCRYRLRQVGRQLGIDLADPDERLVLWLQLRVLGEGSW